MKKKFNKKINLYFFVETKFVMKEFNIYGKMEDLRYKVLVFWDHF